MTCFNDLKKICICNTIRKNSDLEWSIFWRFNSWIEVRKCPTQYRYQIKIDPGPKFLKFSWVCNEYPAHHYLTLTNEKCFCFFLTSAYKFKPLISIQMRHFCSKMRTIILFYNSNITNLWRKIRIISGSRQFIFTYTIKYFLWAASSWSFFFGSLKSQGFANNWFINTAEHRYFV